MKTIDQICAVLKGLPALAWLALLWVVAVRWGNWAFWVLVAAWLVRAAGGHRA